jgi:acetolactate synthase-1/2/3 large subunit
MNIQELATAVQEELPVVIAILNNGYLGMVRQWQEFFYNRRYSSTCLRRSGNCPENCDCSEANCPPYRPDFVKLAEAYGAVGIRVTDKKSIENALETAKSISDRPIIIDFIIERESNVFPMVPPGAGIQEMLL